MAAEPAAERERLIRQPHAAFDRVRAHEDTRGFVDDRDRHDVGVEDLGDLVADEVVHRLHVEVGGQALLDAVDDRQLGCALIGLGQQPLGLVERRAFSSVTLIALASVCSRRTSASVNAFSTSRFWRLMTPVTASPAIIGTKMSDFGSSPSRIGSSPISTVIRW